MNGKTVIARYPFGIKDFATITNISGEFKILCRDYFAKAKKNLAKLIIFENENRHKELLAMNSQNNENKPIEGEDFYYTPEGYKCFTEKYHLKRGYCCRSGCRHCPYGFDKKTGTNKKTN